MYDQRQCDVLLIATFAQFASQQRLFHTTRAAIARIDDVRATVSHHQLEGSITKFALQQRFYQQLVRNLNVSTVCETGYNVGHSAALWLTSGATRVVSFDIPKVYANATLEYVKTLGSIDYIPGDSTKTLPHFRDRYWESCDLISIDGGHSYDVAFADFQNFFPLASGCKFWVSDDTFCLNDPCYGPSKSVRRLYKKGVVRVAGGVSIGTHGFAFGRYLKDPKQS